MHKSYITEESEGEEEEEEDESSADEIDTDVFSYDLRSKIYQSNKGTYLTILISLIFFGYMY